MTVWYSECYKSVDDFIVPIVTDVSRFSALRLWPKITWVN